MGGPHRREHHVAAGELVPELVEGRCPDQGSEVVVQARGTRASERSEVRLTMTSERTPLAGQGLGDALAHLPCPHHQDPGSGQAARPALGGQGHGTVRERGDAPGDGRLRPHPFAGLDGMPEELARAPGPDVPSCLGLLPGSAHLAEDLGLTDDGRVEPGGHREEMLVTSSSNRTDWCSSISESTGLPLVAARNSCSSATPSWKRSTTA